jgi:hypothetical protein
MSTFNFHHFRAQFGEQGATERFEDFVVRCVDATRSNVRSMRAQGGDWGIDAFVGELDGELVIWQAKFFLDGLGTPQRRQVEESLASALKQAAQRDHTVAGWTLCLPIDLSPQERTWWERFAKQREKAHRIPIQLWERLDFERMTGMPECANVRAEYFPQLPAIHAPAPPAVQAPPDGTVFDEMLFVAQLRAAGMAELDSAKEQFYNAEVLTREAGDRQLRSRIDALDGLRADLRSAPTRRRDRRDGTVKGHMPSRRAPRDDLAGGGDGVPARASGGGQRLRGRPVARAGATQRAAARREDPARPLGGAARRGPARSGGARRA